jgi:hypothetical protein
MICTPYSSRSDMFCRLPDVSTYPDPWLVPQKPGSGRTNKQR